MFHPFAFSPSKCAPIGSAEQSTNTFLVAWPAHNLMIPLPASPTHILFWFAQTITFSPFYLYWSINASITLTSSSLQANPQKELTNIQCEWETVWEVFPELSENRIGNLQQSLHLALPPSAILTFPSLLTKPSPPFPTRPTPTPILTPQTTSTTPTPPHQPQLLSHQHHHTNYKFYHHSHTHHIPQTTTPKKCKKNLLAPHPPPPPQRPQSPCPSTCLLLPSCPRNNFPEGQNNPPRSPSQRNTHPHSVHYFNWFQAKMTQKISLPIHTPQD